MNASRGTIGPVIALGVRADAYSRCSSRSLVPETSPGRAIRDRGEKKKEVDRTIDRSAGRCGYHRDPMEISAQDSHWKLFILACVWQFPLFKIKLLECEK